MYQDVSYSYHLENTNSNVTTVCKNFFLATLGIKEDVVYGAFKKRQDSGIVADDARGKHNSHNATSPAIKREIIRHISSFETLTSDYCRKNISRK